MLTDNLNEEYWLIICKVVLMEWRDPKVSCNVCNGLEIRWHRALEQRYGIENPGHMDPIPCPACSGSNRKSWTNKARHEAAGNTPNMKSFSSIWIPRIEDILQMAYDKESVWLYWSMIFYLSLNMPGMVLGQRGLDSLPRTVALAPCAIVSLGRCRRYKKLLGLSTP